MDKKYFFFDIDGTLTSVKTHGLVLESTKEAVKQAKERGHFLAIATGRPYYFAKDIANEVGIDHLVCNGGNDLYIHQKCIRHKPLNRKFCIEIIEECLEKNISFCVSVDDTSRRFTHTTRFVEDMKGEHFIGELKVIKHLDYHQFPAFERILLAIPEGMEETMRVFQKHGLPMRYHPNSCILEPDQKDKGICDMMELLKKPMDDVVVFGDSRNDIRMFQAAPFSIAMGNAIEEVKQLADYVTLESDEHGIQHALKHFSWI